MVSFVPHLRFSLILVQRRLPLAPHRLDPQRSPEPYVSHPLKPFAQSSQFPFGSFSSVPHLQILYRVPLFSLIVQEVQSPSLLS